MKRLAIAVLCFSVFIGSSVQARQNKSDWYISYRGRFSIRMPGSAAVEAPANDGYVRNGNVSSTTKNASFVVNYSCFCERLTDRVGEQKLDELEMFLRSRPGHKILNKKNISLENRVGTFV